MGLCKCSRRRVTNLFCFVHRVNVCEDCLVSQHPRCIVQSYLRWLEDSDYDAICTLCTESVSHGEVIRLICYDLFHVKCLQRYLEINSISNFECPKCKESIIPPDQLLSPVAQVFRSKLHLVKRTNDPILSNRSVIAAPNEIRDERTYSLHDIEPKEHHDKYLKSNKNATVMLKRYYVPILLFIVIIILILFFLTQAETDHNR